MGDGDLRRPAPYLQRHIAPMSYIDPLKIVFRFDPYNFSYLFFCRMGQAELMTFNILIIGQSGRLQYEAIMFLASLRQSAPHYKGQVFVAVPQHTERWNSNPTITDPEIRALIKTLGRTISPFENTYFGEDYPYSDKIEVLSVLPEGEPFIFFDTDTLITGAIDSVPFDFERPSASSKVDGTWPVIELYGPGHTAT